MNLAASQLNPKPHARPAAASILATAGTYSPARELNGSWRVGIACMIACGQGLRGAVLALIVSYMTLCKWSVYNAMWHCNAMHD